MVIKVGDIYKEPVSYSSYLRVGKVFSTHFEGWFYPNKEDSLTQTDLYAAVVADRSNGTKWDLNTGKEIGGVRNLDLSTNHNPDNVNINTIKEQKQQDIWVL